MKSSIAHIGNFPGLVGFDNNFSLVSYKAVCENPEQICYRRVTKSFFYTNVLHWLRRPILTAQNPTNRCFPQEVDVQGLMLFCACCCYYLSLPVGLMYGTSRRYIWCFRRLQQECSTNWLRWRIYIAGVQA